METAQPGGVQQGGGPGEETARPQTPPMIPGAGLFQFLLPADGQVVGEAKAG